jgi:general secretion pathway protein G
MISINKQNKDGFTLIEILIAVALVLILGGIATFSYRGILASSARKATITTLKAIKNAIDNYETDIGELPENLRDLVKKPSNEKAAENWHAPYMDKEPKDGWKHAFYYSPTPEGGEHPYALYSYGPKGKGAPKNEWIDVWKQ